MDAMNHHESCGFCICRGWGQFLVVLIAKVIMGVQFPVRHRWWKKILHRLGCPKCVVLYQYQDLFGHRNWCRIFVPSTVWVRMCVADGFFECFNLPIVLKYVFEAAYTCFWSRWVRDVFLIDRFLLKHDGWKTRPSSRCHDKFRTYRSLG